MAGNDIRENEMPNGTPIKVRALDDFGNSILVNMDNIRDIKYYSIAKGEERYLDFNHSGIVCLFSDYTAYSCIVVTVSNKLNIFVLSNESIHYAVGEDIGNKICFYKKNATENFYLKNNMNVDVIVKIRLL